MTKSKRNCSFGFCYCHRPYYNHASLFYFFFTCICLYLYNVPVKSKLKHPPPPGIPRAFDVFCCPVGREFDELSLPRGGAFDHYSYGVGNLIASFDFMLRRADSTWRDKSWQRQAQEPVSRSSRVITGPVKLFCFPFQMGISKVLKLYSKVFS